MGYPANRKHNDSISDNDEAVERHGTRKERVEDTGVGTESDGNQGHSNGMKPRVVITERYGINNEDMNDWYEENDQGEFCTMNIFIQVFFVHFKLIFSCFVGNLYRYNVKI